MKELPALRHRDVVHLVSSAIRTATSAGCGPLRICGSSRALKFPVFADDEKLLQLSLSRLA